MAQARTSESKGLLGQVQDLWQLVLEYAKQETVEPIKGLGRFVAWGLAGSIALGIGLALLLLAGLRVLQVETDTTFTGNLSWVPYLIVLAAGALIAVLALSRVSAGSKRAEGKKR